MRCRADERVEDSHYSQEYSLALIQKLVQRNFIIFSRDGGVEGLNLPSQSILHSHLGCIYHSFSSAGVYGIYILSILPSYLGCNFQYTPALEKRMAIHCLESGWIGKCAPFGNLHPSALEGCKLPQGAYFPIHPTSRQCIITIFFDVIYILGTSNFIIWLCPV